MPQGIATDPTTGNLYVSEAGTACRSSPRRDVCHHVRLRRLRRRPALGSAGRCGELLGQPLRHRHGQQPRRGMESRHASHLRRRPSPPVKNPKAPSKRTDAVAVDSSGNIFVADTGHNRVARVQLERANSSGSSAQKAQATAQFKGIARHRDQLAPATCTWPTTATTACRSSNRTGHSWDVRLLDPGARSRSTRSGNVWVDGIGAGRRAHLGVLLDRHAHSQFGYTAGAAAGTFGSPTGWLLRRQPVCGRTRAACRSSKRLARSSGASTTSRARATAKRRCRRASPPTRPPATSTSQKPATACRSSPRRATFVTGAVKLERLADPRADLVADPGQPRGMGRRRRPGQHGLRAETNHRGNRAGRSGGDGVAPPQAASAPRREAASWEPRTAGRELSTCASVSLLATRVAAGSMEQPSGRWPSYRRKPPAAPPARVVAARGRPLSSIYIFGSSKI